MSTDENDYVTKKEANEIIKGVKKKFHSRLAFALGILSIPLAIELPILGIPLLVFAIYWETKNQYWGRTKL